MKKLIIIAMLALTPVIMMGCKDKKADDESSSSPNTQVTENEETDLKNTEPSEDIQNKELTEDEKKEALDNKTVMDTDMLTATKQLIQKDVSNIISIPISIPTKNENAYEYKEITDPEEIKELLNVIHTMEIIDLVSEDKIPRQTLEEELESPIAMSTFKPKTKSTSNEPIDILKFYGKDTNILIINRGIYNVKYGENLKTPYELYQDSKAEIQYADKYGNVLTEDQIEDGGIDINDL